MKISYDYYKVFYYAAKLGSFTQAADALMSNQPNVTRAIKNLETELGCTLFVRDNKGVRMTPEGEKLYEHIALAFEHIQAAEDELAMTQGLKSGVVTIAASGIALHCCLLPALKEYRERYPGVRIRVSNHTTPQAIEEVKSGIPDFAIVTTPFILPKTIREQKVQDIQEVAVCSREFAQRYGKTLTLRELTELPVICLGQHTGTFMFYSRFFSDCGLTLQPDIEVATLDQILPLVRCGLGVGFVPEEFVGGGSDEGDVCVVTLDRQIPQRHICMLRRAGQAPSTAARELKKIIFNVSGMV